MEYLSHNLRWEDSQMCMPNAMGLKGQQDLSKLFFIVQYKNK